MNSLDEIMGPTPDHRPGRSFGAPDLALSGAIDRLILQRAIDDLPAGYRLVFVLHDIEGYEHNEIASLLDFSIGNSKSQLHKARLKLREFLRNHSAQGDTEMNDSNKYHVMRRIPGPNYQNLLVPGWLFGDHPHLQSCKLCRALLADLDTIAKPRANCSLLRNRRLPFGSTSNRQS